MAATFSQLKSSYPTKPKREFYNVLGGQWPSLIDNPNFQNTCAIRMSSAFLGAGISIPAQYKEAIDGSGNTIVLKVKTFKDFIVSQYGESSWGMSKPIGSVLASTDLPQKPGIIAYHADWADASGHFDLWETNKFVGTGNFDSIRDGFSIEMWFLE